MADDVRQLLWRDASESIKRLARSLTKDEKVTLQSEIAALLGFNYSGDDFRRRRATGENPSAVDLDIGARLEKIKAELTQLPKSQREAIEREEIVKLENAVKNAGRPKWVHDPKIPDRSPMLRFLTAPAFIKEVWKDEIVRGRIAADIIAEHDRDLLKAYRQYVAQRKFRKLDLGDAEGLIVFDDPAKPKRGRPPTP